MIKKLFKSLREYKTAAILSPVIVSGEVLMECFIPFVMSFLLDSIRDGEMKKVYMYGAILIVMALVSLTCGFLAGKFCAIASAGFAKNLRHDLYEKVNSFSFGNIDKFSTASLVTRLTTDVTNVQQSFMMIIRSVVRSPFMLIFSFIMATITGSFKMACIFVVILPILGLGLFLVVKKAVPTFNRIFKKYDALNESVQENVKAMRVVKTYVREDYEKDKFDKASNALCDDFIHAEKIVALNSPIMQGAMYASMMCLIAFGSFLIVNTFVKYTSSVVDGEVVEKFVWGELSTGQLSSLITYSVQMLMSIILLSMIFVMISISIESANRIVEVLDEEPEIKNPANPIKEVEDGSIEFKNVSFKYVKYALKNALEDVNLSIPSGATVGILGETGSGKTSLVNLISRLYDVSSGEVLVGKRNVKEYDIKTLRDSVSVVLQKNILFSGTIADNIRWGNLDATLDDIKRVCKLAQASEFVESFPKQYDTYIEQGGSNVSGGQKQRLCIARALLKDPKILILDDSTSAVDTKTDALIRKAFKEEIPNTTKIIIAQRISSIQDSDIIVILKNGTINAVGKHEELLKNNSIYQEIYSSQTKGGEEDA